MDLTDAQLDRYARHLVLPEIGGPGQQRLLAARVLVVGAGGLGAPILLYLAAAGVGTLAVVDPDTVSLSNLQRQVLYGTDDVGRPKVEAAARRLTTLNPDCRVEPVGVRLTADNAARLIDGYDLVIDGCDNFTTRLAVSDACVAARRPLVSAALNRFEGQVAVFDASTGGPCYRCFVPGPPPRQEGDSCAEAGILGAVAGLAGTWAATEAVKLITGAGSPLMGRLLIVDALAPRVRTLRIAKDPACPACGG